MKNSEFIQAKSNAVRYIMYKPRTVCEVRKKLLALEYGEELIEEVVNELLLLEYLNDEIYARKFIENSKRIKPMAKSLIKYKLREKGISNDIIELVLFDTEINEVEIAKRLFLKKTKGKLIDEKELIKVKSFLARKGFSIGVINKAIEQI